MLSIYFWLSVYRDAQKGSMAWLLLALTAVFLIAASIFPAIAISRGGSEELYYIIIIFLSFWSMIYITTFAIAGFMLFKAFKTIPRENIGEYLLEGLEFTVPSSDEVSTLLGDSLLVEYTPDSRYEDGVIEVVLRLFGELRNVILISSEPRTSIYRDKLGDLMDIGAMKFVNITVDGDKIRTEDGMITVPVKCLKDLPSLFEMLPGGVRVIFEPISHLIPVIGKDETYKDLSRLIDFLSSNDLPITAFINTDAQPEEVAGMFEGLFLNHAVISSEKIEVTKGKKKMYIRYMAGEQFYMDSDGSTN